MNASDVQKALDAIESGDTASALTILKAMIVAEATDDPGDMPPADPNAPPADATAAGSAADMPPPDQTAAVAASRELMRITATKTPGEAVAALERMYADVKSLAADRAALDLSERQGLVAELIKAGAETPATAWEGDAAKRQPKARLMSEPIAELRDRVKIVVAAAGARRSVVAGHRPPADDAEGGRVVKTSRGEITLSASEVKNCEAARADVNAYAENKAIRASARSKN